MESSLLIAVDAMSGDHGPRVCVPGALAALAADSRARLALVGDPKAIKSALGAAGAAPDRIDIVPASQVVTMDDTPREAIRRKKDSSMRRAIDLVATGQAAACVSAGNTGALMSTAHFVLGMIAGIERPAILAPIPAEGRHTLMLDLGANHDATPDQLCQFAVMGGIVATRVAGIARPKVALLNIGEEDIKGHAKVQEAHRRLSESKRVNYVGYAEGTDVFTGAADVVVTDGFTGNVALKSMEGLARMIGEAIRTEFSASPLRRLAALAAWPALAALKTRLDPRPYNGASMVGLAGVVIKSHGSADQLAFAHAVRTGIVEAVNGIPSLIRAELAGGT